MIKRITQLYGRYCAWLGWNPPGALTSKGWRLFNEEFKEKAPIRYWIGHDFRHAVTLPIKWKYDAVRNWIRFRTYDKYHIVKTGLKPDYYGFGERILHANFNMLKDFVECDKSWHGFWSQDEKEKQTWCQKYIPFYWTFVEFRRPDLGINHLEWEMTLDDPSLPPQDQSPEQACSAREQMALYKWWTEIRPSRKEEPMIEYSDQGLGMMSILDDDFDHDAEDYKRNQDILERNEKLREEWNREDEEMLIRLVKIREHLWT
jgi:hypothetical protein